MNKNIAVLVSVVMVVALAVTVVVSTDSDATTYDKGKIYVLKGSTGYIDVQTSESQTDYAEFQNTVLWTMGDTVLYNNGNNDDTAPASNGGAKAIIDVTKGSQNGAYRISVTGESAGVVGKVNIAYNLTTSNQPGVPGLEQTHIYTFEVEVLPSTFGVVGDLANAKNGADYTGLIEYSDITEANYTFYAIGLPNGLSMLPNGDIRGVPNDVATEYTITIVATHKESGLSIKMTDVLTVDAADSNAFDYTVSGNPADNCVKVTDGNYLVLQNTEITIKTTVSGGSDAKVIEDFYIFNDNGEQEFGAKDASTCAFTANGTGQFTVTMVNAGEVEQFTITVIGVVTDVETGIGFAPGYSQTDGS